MFECILYANIHFIYLNVHLWSKYRLTEIYTSKRIQVLNKWKAVLWVNQESFLFEFRMPCMIFEAYLSS